MLPIATCHVHKVVGVVGPTGAEAEGRAESRAQSPPIPLERIPPDRVHELKHRAEFDVAEAGPGSRPERLRSQAKRRVGKNPPDVGKAGDPGARWPARSDVPDVEAGERLGE